MRPFDTTGKRWRVLRALLTTTLLGAAGAMLAAPAATDAASSEQIVALPTRPGVTLKVLVSTPTGAPTASLIVFPGGNGARHFSERNDQVVSSSNFLVRHRGLFVAEGLLTAIVDTPSDRPNGMNDAFRTSQSHVLDIHAVQSYLAQVGAPIHYVGTSRGTISAAHLALNLGGGPSRASGVVLTASMARIDQQPLLVLQLPALLVHHAADTCAETPYQAVQGLAAALTRSPRVDLVTVQGGLPAVDTECQPRGPHGFYGQEEAVVRAIAGWLRGEPVPALIGG